MHPYIAQALIAERVRDRQEQAALARLAKQARRARRGRVQGAGRLVPPDRRPISPAQPVMDPRGAAGWRQPDAAEARLAGVAEGRSAEADERSPVGTPAA